MGIAVGGAVAGRLEVGPGTHEVSHHLGAGVGLGRRGGRVEVVDLHHLCGLGQTGVLGVGRAQSGRRDGVLHEALGARWRQRGW